MANLQMKYFRITAHASHVYEIPPFWHFGMKLSYLIKTPFNVGFLETLVVNYHFYDKFWHLKINVKQVTHIQGLFPGV